MRYVIFGNIPWEEVIWPVGILFTADISWNLVSEVIRMENKGEKLLFSNILSLLRAIQDEI